MPRGDTSKYTHKQRRQARQIKEGYEKRSIPRKEAASRAWATVNKESSGGKKVGGAGRSASAARKASSQRGRVASARAQSSRGTAGRSAAGGGAQSRTVDARKPSGKSSVQSRSRTSRK